MIKFFDTTLRDGEQSPGINLNVEEKLQIARQLARLRVDVIEAGFPVASPGDFASVRAIAREVQGPVIAGLSRAIPRDIDRCWEAVSAAAKPRIHTFIATSPIHMKHKLAKSPSQVLEMAVKAVQHAASTGAEVEFSAEDATRSEVPFLIEVFTAVVEAGAKVINVPDTVGYTTPGEFASLISQVRGAIGERAVISVHCHNDLGLATANSLAAIMAGATQVECTINGLGERAGNAALEEIVMALRTRTDFYQKEYAIETEQIHRTSRLVSLLTGVALQPNKAIVGANAFAHEAGIHQDGVLKERTTYEIMTPESIGLQKNRLVLGKHSGRHAFKARVEELGYQLSDEELTQAFEAFIDLADKKKEVGDGDIQALVEEKIVDFNETYQLDYVHVSSGNTTIPTATVGIRVNGDPRHEAASGDGPVDAVYRAINRLTGIPLKLEEYQLRAATGGTDALGEVMLRIRENGKIFTGRGVSTDIIEASARAYLHALNKLLMER